MRNWSPHAFMLTTLFACTLASHTAAALPIANPNPTAFGNDIGGSGLFAPAQPVVSLEFSDPGDFQSITGTTFGFYFDADPTNLISIFDGSDDQALGTQQAVVDFALGRVIDVDAGSVVENFFTPGLGPIGLFITPDPVLTSLLGLPGTLFSDPTRNGGVDYMASFALLGNSAPNPFLHLFAAPDPFTPGSMVNLYGGVTLNAAPVSVPEPTTSLLLLSGIGLLAVRRRRHTSTV